MIDMLPHLRALVLLAPMLTVASPVATLPAVAATAEPVEAAEPAPPDARLRALLARAEALYRRLAVLAIQSYLAAPGREALRAELGELLARPAEHMTVYSGDDNGVFVRHLEGCDPDKRRYAAIDPKAVVVVYLNGREGGGSRVGVILDREEGTELAVVPVPGK